MNSPYPSQEGRGTFQAEFRWWWWGKRRRRHDTIMNWSWSCSHMITWRVDFVEHWSSTSSTSTPSSKFPPTFVLPTPSPTIEHHTSQHPSPSSPMCPSLKRCGPCLELPAHSTPLKPRRWGLTATSSAKHRGSRQQEPPTWTPSEPLPHRCLNASIQALRWDPSHLSNNIDTDPPPFTLNNQHPTTPHALRSATWLNVECRLHFPRHLPLLTLSIGDVSLAPTTSASTLPCHSTLSIKDVSLGTYHFALCSAILRTLPLAPAITFHSATLSFKGASRTLPPASATTLCSV